MSPAERLRSAAERMDALHKEATPGPWTMFEEHGRDHTDEGWWYIGVTAPDPNGDKPMVVAECLDPTERIEDPQADADLIAALRPLAPVLAAQLRTAAVRAGNITKDPASGRLWHGTTWCNGEVAVTCTCFDDALALADAILGGAA